MNVSHFSSSVLSWGACFSGSGKSRSSRAQSSSKMSLRQNSLKGISKLSGKRLLSGCSESMASPLDWLAEATVFNNFPATMELFHGTD